jgi:kumamolisin
MVAAGATAIALPLALGNVAIAATPNPNSPTPVQSGLTASALPNATVFGDTPASTPETVSFVLKEQNLPQLQSSVERGLQNFLTVSQFARTYGQSSHTVSELQQYLKQFGITTQAYPDNIDVVATGTAGEFDSALAVTQHQYHVPRVAGRNGLKAIPAQTVHANNRAPELPFRLSQSVLAILGLTNYSPFLSQTAHIDQALTPANPASTNSCIALTGLPSACNLPSDFATNYGLKALNQRGGEGAGQTIGIVTLAALDPGAPQYFWANVAHTPASNRTVTVTNVDGGPGAPNDTAGTGETDLDVEQSGGVAPFANVIDYQAPNTDSGFADAFFQAASQNIAGTISSSWGESETIIKAGVASGTETPAYQAVFDEAFLEMAAQGQSGFVSSADDGAYTASADLGTTNLSVDSPGDSPFITSAGGTTLPFSATLTGPDGSAPISVSAQRAWGWDYLWQAIATTNNVPLATAAEKFVAGSGGGFSTIEPTPSYQQAVPGIHSFSAVQYLTPTAFENVQGITEPTAWNFNPTPAVTHGVGTGRVEPDVSTDADPESGYLLYEPSAPQNGGAVLQGGWGGTSFVAPELNGSAADINSLLGHRVGFWNPQMYSQALQKNSPLTPLTVSGTSNDNIFYTGTPGLKYDAATGLGYPNLTALGLGFGARH